RPRHNPATPGRSSPRRPLHRHAKVAMHQAGRPLRKGLPMVRTIRSPRVITLFVLCCLAGCQSAEKASLQPIPPDAPPPTFGELMQRGKTQINAAHEFYYSDRWKDVEQAATAIKETGTYLTKLPQTNWNDKQKAQFAQLTKEFNEAA